MSPLAPKRPCSRMGAGCPHLQPCPVHGKRPWEHGRASAAARGYGYEWVKLRAQVLAEEPYCPECAKEGREEPTTTVDHKVAKAQGGTDDRGNLRALCHRHHESKSGREGRQAQR